MSITEKQIDIEGDARLVGVGVKFERIRRITGYLVGDMRYWNNAKRAEEKDRLAHTSFQRAS